MYSPMKVSVFIGHTKIPIVILPNGGFKWVKESNTLLGKNSLKKKVQKEHNSF